MKFKCVFFDCDGVLTFDNVWTRMHRHINLPEEIDMQWFNDFHNGVITYTQWVSNLEGFYKDALKREHIDIITENLSVNPEAIEIMSYLESKNIPTAIISSGFDTYIEKYADMLKVKRWHANTTFIFEPDGTFQKMQTFAEDKQAKVKQVQAVCDELGIKPTEALFVGDAINDVGAFDFTEHGILYKSDDERCVQHAWIRIQNLNELKEII